jgi:hypothetical protein
MRGPRHEQIATQVGEAVAGALRKCPETKVVVVMLDSKTRRQRTWDFYRAAELAHHRRETQERNTNRLPSPAERRLKSERQNTGECHDQ